MYGGEGNSVSVTKFVGQLAVKTVSVDSVGNSRCFDSNTVPSLFRPGQFLCVVRIAEKRFDSLWCSVFGFVALSPIRLFSALMRTDGRARSADCKCFVRVRVSKVLVCRPLTSRFLVWSEVVIQLGDTDVTVG